MSRSLTALPMLVGLLTVSSAAPVPKGRHSVQDYYPTQVGAMWVYKFGGREVVEVVTAIEEQEGAKLVTVCERTSRRDNRREVVSVSDKGIFRVAFSGAKLTQPVCLLKLPDKSGGLGRWETRDEFHQSKFHSTDTAHEPEWVRTEAGRYNAVRVESEYTIDRTTRRATFWYAPHVGLVKMTSGDTVKELKSFTPGKD